MDMEAAGNALVQEARDLLSEMETALLRMEREGFDEESIHAVFRAAHTIKGSAGLFGLDGIVGFTHVLETVLDEIRSGKLASDGAMISLFLECGDHLRALIDNFERSAPESAEQVEEGKKLVGLLQAARAPIGKALVAPAPVVTPVEEIASGDGGVASEAWHISLRLAPDILRAGMDPLSFFRYLSSMGEIVKIEVLDDRLPVASEMDPEQFYLGFEIQFRSDATRQAIENVFEFVAEGSTIRLVPPHARVAEYLELIQALPEGPERLGEILVSCGALTPHELQRVLAEQASIATSRPVLGEILVEEKIVPPVVVAAALQKQKANREKATQESRSVKVDVDKLDHLINLVGELVIAAAGAKIAAVQEKSAPCEEAVNGVTKLVEEIRDAALGVRMIPVGEVFNRFPRVVRDLSKDLGKKIDLVITGAETELDKSMVEKLVDPLMHIMRNAIDHGIEAVEKRLAAGKSETGTIRMNAWHESGSILIEVSDDGGGLNRERILEKALAAGLVQPGQELTDREVSRLIFEPGFSTAEAVTNLSGRGVGMDVVRRNIEALRGEIEVESRRGEGSTMRIRLPLTLAIIDGFQIMAGNAAYVVPLDLVKECADLDEANVHGDLVSLRGESLPFIRLRDLFSIPGNRPARESLVVVQYGPNRVGIVVDQLAGELQAVIKPMGTLFRELKAIGGTTILGNGSVALILDVPHLSQTVSKRKVAA
jgi:two-component system, chemotaxis family, sensor kinase CheA